MGRTTNRLGAEAGSHAPDPSHQRRPRCINKLFSLASRGHVREKQRSTGTGTETRRGSRPPIWKPSKPSPSPPSQAAFRKGVSSSNASTCNLKPTGIVPAMNCACGPEPCANPGREEGVEMTQSPRSRPSVWVANGTSWGREVVLLRDVRCADHDRRRFLSLATLGMGRRSTGSAASRVTARMQAHAAVGRSRPSVLLSGRGLSPPLYASGRRSGRTKTRWTDYGRPSCTPETLCRCCSRPKRCSHAMSLVTTRGSSEPSGDSFRPSRRKCTPPHPLASTESRVERSGGKLCNQLSSAQRGRWSIRQLLVHGHRSFPTASSQSSLIPTAPGATRPGPSPTATSLPNRPTFFDRETF